MNLRRLIKDKEKLIFVIGIIGIILFNIFYGLFFKTAPPEEVDEEEGIPVMPEDFYRTINKVNIIKGERYSGDLESLKKEDNDHYEIRGEELDIEFEFKTDLSIYPLDYYDIYFTLIIDDAIGTGDVNFEVYKEYEWEKVLDIKELPLEIRREYSERTTKFRIKGDPSGLKKIKIDKLNVILTHDGNDNGFSFREGEMLFWRVTGVEHNGYTTEGYSADTTLQRDYWYDGGLPFYQISQSSYSADTYLDITMDLNGLDGNITDYTDFKELTINVNWEHTNIGTHYLRGYLWDYSTNSWDSDSRIQITESSDLTVDTFNWGEKFDGLSQNPENYIKDQKNWRFKIESHIEHTTSLTLETEVQLTDSEFELKGEGYGFSKIDYNSIECWTEPESPLNIPYEFEIFANISQNLEYDSNFEPLNSYDPQFNIIDMESGWKRGWADLSFDEENDLWKKSFADIDFPSGEYTIWIRSILPTEMDNFTSYKAIEVNFRDVTTKITFTNPDPYSIVSDHYNLDITASIEAEDWYAITDVDLKLWSDTMTYLDWVSMTDLGNDEYEYEIDPIDYPNGKYYVSINATDGDNYIEKESVFYIQNEKPQITWLNSTEFYKTRDTYVKVVDPEDDPISSVKVKVYDNDPNVPEQDWDNFEYQGDNLWNYTFNVGEDPESFKNGLYTVLVNASDGKGNNQITKICLIQKEGANFTINSPNQTLLQSPLERTLALNLTTKGDIIQNPRWDLLSLADYDTTYDNYDWSVMTNNTVFGEEDFTLWGDSFRLDEIEYGEYYLMINVTDDYSGTSYYKQRFIIHPIINYILDESDVDYQKYGITLGDDDLRGSVTINHNSIAKERDFTVNLSNRFSEASDYHIYRGTNDYEPSNFLGGTGQGVYTEWIGIMDEYRPTDTIHFDLQDPSIIQDIDESTEFSLVFSLQSKYELWDLTFRHTWLGGGWDDANYYNFTLYYQFEGNWIAVDRDQYNITVSGYGGQLVEYTVFWEHINADSAVRFKLEARETGEEKPSFAPVIWALGIGLAFGFGFSFITKYALPTDYSDPSEWGKVKWALAVIGLSVGSGVITFFLSPLWISGISI
jgi:hypothetical protein